MNTNPEHNFQGTRTTCSAIRTAIAPLLLGLTLASTSYGIDSIETSLEVLDSDLFNVTLLTARADDTLGNWELQTTISQSDYDLDFRPAPFDLLGEAAQLDEQTYSATLSATKQIKEAITLNLGLGYRDGFPNYRAVWLDTYFDQHFEPLEGVPGHELYQDFDASASSINAGLTWEYLKANGIANLSIARIQDEVSPGYEIDFDGIARSELVLATTAISLTSDNVLSQRLRSRIAISASETSAREIRYSGEFALNAAIADRFIWRNKVGASTENPQFDAYFFDTTLEYAASDKVSIYASARRYSDNGEVENALLFTTAAPGLRNDSLGLGLRYTGETWSSKISLKHSKSDFDETNANTDFFRNLYIDADWLTFQVALARSF